MLTGLDKESAMRHLVEADGSVKTAVVMHKKQIAKPEAENLLNRCDGNLRRALG
jgi:N-acetylmuramic acid 6-phosphate (MurNAc-6-P) etherase